ncbi:MAG: hypothetical protein JNM36_16825 [Chitinophagales bacterium]|nr:hypothetical protein [Chitinophagales bacterium]
MQKIKNNYCSVLSILSEKAVFAVKNNDIFVRMAKRVRDAEGGVSQCGEQRSTKRSEARSSPTRRETPK